MEQLLEKLVKIKELLGRILIKLHLIGQIKQHEPSAVSCRTSYYRQLAYITLEAGTWLISGIATFPYNNTTGVRRAYVSNATSNYDNVTTAPPAVANMLYQQLPVTGAYQSFVHVGPMPIQIISTTTYRLIGWQNSGSSTAVNVTGRIYAVRIV